jgi:hypothetical protein
MPRLSCIPKRASTLLLSLAILSLETSSLHAQTPSTSAEELQALANLKALFATQINSQSQKLTDQYERALARMESEIADAGDYEQALQIKKRRDQLQQILASNTSSTTPALPLTPLAAKGTGITASSDGSLTGWRIASHYAEWTLTKLAPGDYFLELDALMTAIPTNVNDPSEEPAETALFEIYEVSLLAGAADNRRSFELSLTKGSPLEFKPQRIGPMRFARSPITLRLAASKSYAFNQVQFKNIRLVPAPTSVPQTVTNVIIPPTSNVDSVRSSLAFALELAYKPINDQYADQLQELEQRFPDWQALLDNEKRGIEKRRSPTSKSKDTNALHLPKPLASLGGISGFQDLENVTFVNHPENTGDRFRVSQDGREFFIHLLWLKCASPSSDPASSAANTPFNQHFGLTNEDAALFGRAALQFTSGYLSGRTFRLLARNTPDSDGTLPALLFLPDIGLFHNLLIDQGLAAFVGKTGSGGTLERALQHSISDRENEARSRNPRPGAWALSPTQPAESTQP